MPVSQTTRQHLAAVIKNPAWICLAWFGMTAGVSLLATPARFAARSITRPVALDVGRVVFATLNKAEFVALIILLLLVRISGYARELWAACALLALILVAQTAWLLPELAARTDLIMSGIEPPPSIAHAAYSTLELGKLLTLLYVGFRSLLMMHMNNARPLNT